MKAQDEDRGYGDIRRLVAKLLPSLELRVLFDVGANVGQTVQHFLVDFPDAHIWAFEPVPESFAQLRATHGGNAAVVCVNVALGGKDASATMTARRASTMNRIVAPGEGKGATTIVQVRTGDGFCAENAIDRINYLKIDTEGHDLEVLHGFQKMLSQQSIDLVEVEAGLNPGNERHVPFETFKAHMEKLGYYLFHLRHAAYERQGAPRLRRCNMVFASSAVLDRNPRSKA